MKRGVAAATVALLVLAGCGNDPKEPDGPSGTFRVATVNVDGRYVRCVTWKDGYGGGITCDWGRDPACEGDDAAEGAPKC